MCVNLATTEGFALELVSYFRSSHTGREKEFQNGGLCTGLAGWLPADGPVLLSWVC